METTQGFLFAVGWFLLRFGLPVIATILIGWLFKNFDTRWQAEGEAYRKEAGLDVVKTTIDCWVFNNCPEEKRKNCQAYQEQNLPCWQHFRGSNGILKEKCLGCGVFRGVPVSISGD